MPTTRSAMSPDPATVRLLPPAATYEFACKKLAPIGRSTRRESRESRETASPLDLGCVDWYLYPVRGNANPTAGSRSAPRGGVAAPSRENPAA